ncbi:hypothetical protein BOTBODRAFT_165096 [Botryobasidium botryosum FD-172 SS1]|uniref:Amidohydrolase-related domain-containing protein n=1 Tax=Botryobasidium botryosum (strain FD-172 SS1) TaxID=930990 RepID=A0A067M0J0_BOTB1|nr:hypothetical protein BOTBODRAFT_165096 [Botryobasidium botryosum FD-172 SS1]
MDSKLALPTTRSDDAHRDRTPRSPPPQRPPLSLLCIGCVSLITLAGFFNYLPTARFSYTYPSIPPHADRVLRECKALKETPGPPAEFFTRTQSDRFVPGTKPVWIRNATIWGGGSHGLGTLHGDVFIAGGIIKAVGHVPREMVDDYKYVDEVNAQNLWITPGIFDMHSHIGVDSIPNLRGAADTNSPKGIAQPWIRSLDALNTHDDSYKLSVAGGVTTSLILPGSAGAIGGQAFAIKLRDTAEGSASSKLLEPPYTLGGSHVDPSVRPRWRHMKHACGENPSRFYQGTRMDTAWAFRHAYNEARKIKEEQDAYCEKAEAGKWEGLASKIPENLQWEALVDVLRGRVKVNVHCYEGIDFDDIVRLSNEFQFPVAAYHHAHDAYLVPELLKKTWGGPPAVAIFSLHSRYKREAYRGSEYAPYILAKNGLRVIMKSDHPVTDSRYLPYQAAQAHYYGLPTELALASVTTTPAEAAGFGHRLGYVRKGYDADLVLWDSHPLALGATPAQVWIDGIAQLSAPFVSQKPRTFQDVPNTPNFEKEAAEAVKYDGLPPLKPKEVRDVVFTNVRTLWGKEGGSHVAVPLAGDANANAKSQAGTVVVKNGKIECAGSSQDCLAMAQAGDMDVIDLQGGSVAPGLISFGTPLGLAEITSEYSTNDGPVADPLEDKVPSIAGGDDAVIQACDGLQFGGRDTLLTFRAGVTAAVTPPTGGHISGLSTAFYLGAEHKLQAGAVIKDIAALHVAVGHLGLKEGPSISTQIATLRRLLLSERKSESGESENWFKEAAHGNIPLIVKVDKADHMATLLVLKKQVEGKTGKTLRLSFAGGLEAHLLAKEIGEAGVGVILNPVRSFPTTFDQLRIIPGPPLSEDTPISALLKHNVTVGLGVEDKSEAPGARFDIGWAALDGNGKISKEQAIALATTNLEKIFGIDTQGDFVAYHGGDVFDMESKAVAVMSARREQVALF